MLTEAIREFGKEFPSLIRPLLSERDEYMVRITALLANAGNGALAYGKKMHSLSTYYHLECCVI